VTEHADLLDPLWASTLDRIQLDALDRSLQITAHAIDRGMCTRYLVVCKGVSEIRYTRGPSCDWEFVEISEAEVSELPGGVFRIRVELWAPENEMIVIAEEVVVSQKSEVSDA
jgi:hypothetical protein